MAKTFNYGAGIWATKTGSSMAYNDQNDNYKPLPFSVTRDSIATRVNKQGLIEVVGQDKLRIDYTDSTNGVALLENSATNLITYSEDFSNAWWLKLNNVTVSAEKVISPDGTLNASQLIFDGTSGGRIEKNITGLTQGADYSVSVYARVSSGTQVVNFGSVNDFEYTLTTEWQRLTSTEAENDTTGFPRLKCNDAATIEVWGFQLEQNSVASSYIATSGSTYQRQADVANGAGNSEVFNDSEGVLFVDIAALADDATSKRIVISNGTSINDRVVLEYDETSGVVKSWVTGGGTTNGQVDLSNINKTLYNKVALSYQTGSLKVYVSGFNLGNGTGIVTPTGLNTLKFEQATGGNNFYGKAKEIGVYDAVLTDAELEALTSYTSFTNMANELNLTIK